MKDFKKIIKMLFFNKWDLISFGLIALMIVFFYAIFEQFFAISEIAYPVMEFSLVFVVFISSYILYGKYSKRELLKRMNHDDKNKLKLAIFLKIVVYSIYTVLFSLLASFIIDNFFIYARYNLINMNGLPNGRLLWGEFYNYLWFIYFGILETLILITFWYFINHFVKNQKVIIGIFIAIVIYMVFYGNFFVWFLGYQAGNSFSSSGIFIDTEKNINLLINTILFPWLIIGAKGKHVFNEAYGNYFSNQYLLMMVPDYSKFYLSLTYWPYIMILFYYLTGSINSIIRDKQN